MPRNKMVDLRNHIFDAIESLKDGEMEIATAKAINDLAQTVINSAKVEVDALKVIGGDKSEFLQIDDPVEGKFLPRNHGGFEQ